MDGLYIHMRATVDRIDFFFGLFVELKAKDIILRDILVLELAVQVIEFIFYIWLILALQDAHEDVTSVRYFWLDMDDTHYVIDHRVLFRI